MKLPIIDTHCDLLSYLAKVPDARADRAEDIACALPLLQQGNVKMQVLAIYTDVFPGSMDMARLQVQKFRQLLGEFKEELCHANAEFLQRISEEDRISVVAAIENAAGLASEEAPIQAAFENLDAVIKETGRIAYISLTHHTENRFGGGNYTEGIGLKVDGKKLLDYVSGKKIAIDLSHTSDLLAEGILNHIDLEHLDIPVIASHSNFRGIWDHKRNLSDEFAQEIMQRGGIIGVNFLRAFLDNDRPTRILDHILYAFERGFGDQICFGADFFYTKDFPDKSRHPFYFPIVENASKYPSLLENLAEKLSKEQLEKLAYQNAQSFFLKTWA
jgi:membrane dipeptidase